MVALLHLDHDALPFFPMLFCKAKSLCWEEHARLLAYVLLLSNNPILKGVFTNILAACRFDLKHLWAVFSWVFSLRTPEEIATYLQSLRDSDLNMSSKLDSVHTIRFSGTKNTPVIAAIPIFRSYFPFAHAKGKIWYDFGMVIYTTFLVHLNRYYFRSMIDINSFFCSTCLET